MWGLTHERIVFQGSLSHIHTVFACWPQVLFALAHCHDDNVKFSAPVLEILRRPDFGPVMVKIVWFTNIATIVYVGESQREERANLNCG